MVICIETQIAFSATGVFSLAMIGLEDMTEQECVFLFTWAMNTSPQFRGGGGIKLSSRNFQAIPFFGSSILAM